MSTITNVPAEQNHSISNADVRLGPVPPTVRFIKLKDDAQAPEMKTPGSAGADIRAYLEDGPLTLHPGDCKLIPTGLKVWLADEQTAGFLVPRSGLGHKHGIVLGNLTGVIDSDYQGELMVSLWNRGTQSYVVEHGERIAQLIIQPVISPVFQEVDSFDEDSVRGDGGFGSTGKE